jgi:pimeloyl-ACP methyl ester carboxylesterase
MTTILAPKRRLICALLSCFALLTSVTARSDSGERSGYQPIHGLQMYYEIHGSGRPLVLIHGGGSTIGTTFGQVLAPLAEHRQIIAVELQAHGHTADIDRPLSFQQDADDVAALLARLKISQADVLGFSNGGQTAMQIAIRHPSLVRRLVVASAFYKRSGVPAAFWEGMSHATLNDMPRGLKDAYLAIVPDPKRLQAMFRRDAQRMQTFKDWPDDQLRSIQAPTLLLAGDRDVMRPEHIVEMYRLIPHAHMAILPGGHGAYLGEATVVVKGSRLPLLTVAMVEEFLDGAGD